MCLALPYRNALFSHSLTRVCVFIFRRRRRRWDHIFLEGNIFCWWSCCVLFNVRFSFGCALLCVYEIRLCAFMFARIETREEKIFRSIIIGRGCVCGWVVFVSLRGEMCALCWWKIAICFFLWTIGKFNFQFSTTRHSTIARYLIEFKIATALKSVLNIFRDHNIAIFVLKPTRLMTPRHGKLFATLNHFHVNLSNQ